MVKENKVATVSELVETFSRSNVVIATNYRGLSVSEISELRRRLRQIGAQYQVVKNTLAGFAADRAGLPELRRLLQGPTALALGSGDLLQVAKVIAEYQQTWKTTLTIKGALLDRRLFSAEELVTLAKLPSAQVLVARLLGVMKSPLWGLQNVLRANMVRLVGLLQARIRQLEVSDGN